MTGLLAQLGVLASLANTPKVGLHIVARNGFAAALAFSPLGTRWIVPICVAGALFGHVLVFRWLAKTFKGSSAAGSTPV